MNTHMEALEFTKIIEKLQECALSEQAKQVFSRLEPCLDETVCRRRMQETTAAKRILDSLGNAPLASMKGLEETLELAEKGAMLTPEQLTGVARFAGDCRRLERYLSQGEACGPEIAVYRKSLSVPEDLRREIEDCIREDRLYDEASPELRSLRRKMENVEEQIRQKLSHILQSRKQYLADQFIARRNGRYVLPVRRQYQGQFGGTVVEVSGKGATVFMEPYSIAGLQAELDGLVIEEDAEVRRILYTLSALTAESAPAVRADMEVMEVLDVLFAKAKYSASIHAGPVEIGGERRIRILQGRHPLLREEDCVPLDFTLEGQTWGAVITGPNTGGKTVALKTVGLLSLMAQCGLHVPCGEGSYIAMQDGYWCDIGDSQNLAQNLSTFSGHITNVIGILEGASRDSLVLLDELGSGTDPAEGMGIAVAVLEELRQRKCMFLVTTHYPQVKTYAENAAGIVSARMAFDKESLRPLYRLEMGKSGESCALFIAEKLGLAGHLLERASYEVYGRESGAPEPAASSMKAPKSRLHREEPERQTEDLTEKFHMGDSVTVLPEGELGIVYRPADKMGDVIVQVKGVKRRVNHTRLRLKLPASELYPPDYDFSIIFDTVETRKARRILNKRYDPSVSVTTGPEEWD